MSARRMTKRTCPLCLGRKDFYATTCRGCQPKPVGMTGRKGPDHPAWKGGRWLDEDGYVMVPVGDHPWPRRSRYIREHVAVMEIHLGRRLAPNELVHHIDEDRRHNKLWNLRVMTFAAHSAFHRAEERRRREADNGNAA